ncbi:phBC6A51 family helix-turn-helix protein [Heyndrickxia oleronia]|uniref:phBC6A51 family helix-turn-helix protein n=1 Tax=Heyndrickxia oleronia TaxID=38875 RepID=UPI001C0F078B|nr:phBC6A51 family helix-turn-helix protein [Heyndrickxia oleronia]MBU5211059.1 helix-turn-helix domain-containing protein [Heyndrickxia oleronia]
MALKQLGAEHWLAIKYLAQPKRGGLTYEEIAKECNVHVNSLYNWRKDELFIRELKREMVRNTLDKLPAVLDAVPDIIVRDGNAAMFKTLLQAHDMLTEKHEVHTESTGGKSIEDIRAKLERYKAESTTEDTDDI